MPAPLPPARRRLFLALTLALPWLLLLLAEGALRAAGFGSAYPLFAPHPGRPGWLAVAPDVARRWFAGPFVPTPELELFRERKAPNAVRVFFQGESSAQGFPYGHGAMPSRMLGARLAAAFPGREVESVNVAFTAVTSYALLDQAEEIVAQRPDAVLIYAGHNEWYGALGAASARGVGGTRAAARAYLLLRHSRLAQALARLVARARGGGAPAGEAPRTVMALMAGDQRVPLGSPAYDAGLRQLRANLADLLARYRRAGVPVFVGTLASNERDQPPLEGVAASRGADTSASDHFAVARAADARGDAALARRAYRAAKERDRLRFRAPEAVNAVIREEAARHGATVVETQARLAAVSRLGVVGGETMLEHVHPNLRGYAILADAFAEAMRRARVPAAWPADAPAAAPAVTALDSLVGVLRADRLTSGWPFRPRGLEKTPVVDTLRGATAAERLARAVVLGALPWAEATERLRVAAERAGDWAAAERAALALAQEYRYAPEAYVDAARAAIGAGRWDDAAGYARLAAERRETPETARLAGVLALRRGDRVAGLRHLRRASELAPGDRRARAAHEAAARLPALEARAAEAPGDTAALHDLAVAWTLLDRPDRAREALARLLRAAPGHAGARRLLEGLPPGVE